MARYSLQAGDFERFQRGLVAVRTETHKLIAGTDGTVELYDLVNDPGEQVNVAGAAPERVAELRRLLAEWRAGVGLQGAGPGAPGMPAIAPEVAARLKALGYLD